MLNLKDFVQETTKHCDRVKKTVKSLQLHFDVSEFYYCQRFKNGHLCSLTHHPELFEWWWDSNMYQQELFLRKPNIYQSGLVSLESTSNDPFKKSLNVVRDKFKLREWITIVKEYSDYFELFGFWGELERSPEFENVLLKNSRLFGLFCDFFKKELKSLILRQRNESLVCIKDYLTDEFDEVADTFSKSVKSMRSYLVDLGFEGEVRKAESLSPRERQCLKAIVLGMSSKDTAKQLDLSPRTVEFYLENIKNKLDCTNKYELASIARDFEEMNLL